MHHHFNTSYNQSPGNPVPDIMWLKDGQLLVPDAHHQVLSHGRFLQISEAQVADTGRYSCLASNSAGDRSRHFNLNVLGTKLHSYFKYNHFQSEFGMNMIHTGLVFTFMSSVSADCGVGSWRLCRGGDGDSEQPHLSAVWGPVLPSGPHHLAQGRHSLRVHSQHPCPSRFETTHRAEDCGSVVYQSSTVTLSVTGGRTLQILNAKEEDAGRYTCVATNEAGETLKHYEVKVYGESPAFEKNIRIRIL